VLIYDTYHLKPLSIIRGIHYTNLVDASWSVDGHSLFVCSTDGYITIIRFAPGELGLVYTKPISTIVTSSNVVDQSSNIGSTCDHTMITEAAAKNVTPESTAISNATTAHPKIQLCEQKLSITGSSLSLPPCERGPADVIVSPPTKRAKTRITPTLVAVADTTSVNLPKRPAPDAPIDAVDKLSLQSTVEKVEDISLSLVHASKKQKKRIQPTLLAVAATPSAF
jgi:hypothetical protein